MNLVRVAPGDPEPAYDGVAELWFDKEEDLFAAYTTDIGKAVAEDSIAMVVRAPPRLCAHQCMLGSLAASMCQLAFKPTQG